MKRKIGRLIYLASPYTDEDFAIQEQRWKQACAATAHFIQRGYIVYCPIAHCHPIDIAARGTITYDQWIEHSDTMLALCNVLYVLMLKGWVKSNGVAGEIEKAKQQSMPILYVDPRGYKTFTGPQIEAQGEQK